MEETVIKRGRVLRNAGLMVLLGSIFLCTLPWLEAEGQARQSARVLMILSYHPTIGTFFQQNDGVQQGLAEAGYNAENLLLDIEFMDSKRYAEPTHIEHFRKTLEYKTKGKVPYDVVIVADDIALDFALEHHETLLSSSPIVFLGVNDLKFAEKQANNPKVTGVVEKVSMTETLHAIERLTRGQNLYVISDVSVTGRANLANYTAKKAALQRLNSHVLTLDEYTYGELALRLNSVSNSDAILALSAFRDRAGDTKAGSEGIQFLRINTEAPIYTLWEHYLGTGVLGGKVVSHYEQGLAAGRMAAKILEGDKPSELPIMTSSPNVFIFDFEVMQQHGIKVENLPAGSKVINQPITWLEKNQAWLPWVFGFIGIQLVIIVILVINVMLRFQAEKRALFSEQRFRDFAEASSDWLWEMDANLRFTYLSEKYEQNTGLKIKDRIGTERFRNLIKNPDNLTQARIVRHQEDIKNRRAYRDFEYPAIPLKGEGPRWLRISGVPVFDDHGEFQGYRGTGSDITQQVIARHAIEEARHQAELANQAKTEFLAHMSHELRTPLNGIIGFSQMMNSEIFGPLGSGKYKEYSTDIHAAGSHLLDILDDILDLSRIELGAIDLDENAFNVDEAVDVSLSLFRDIASSRGIRLSATTIDETITLFGDERRFKQALINLLANAIKFTNTGGSVDVTCQLNRERCLEVNVRDTGIGIAEEHQSRIREPFSRVEDRMSRSYDGVGLGLSITESIMKLFGGTLVIHSSLGEGTSILMRFPSERTVSPGIPSTPNVV